MMPKPRTPQEQTVVVGLPEQGFEHPDLKPKKLGSGQPDS